MGHVVSHAAALTGKGTQATGTGEAWRTVPRGVGQGVCSAVSPGDWSEQWPEAPEAPEEAEVKTSDVRAVRLNRAL